MNKGIIQSFLSKEKFFGLILPDSWFGKPYDNGHEVTWLEERENKLIIELDNQLYLIFTKPVVYEIVGKELIFSQFKQLVFDWQGYGDMTPHNNIYSKGTVKFSPKPNSIPRILKATPNTYEPFSSQ